MSEKGSHPPSHFLNSAEFCLNNNDPMGAVDNFIRAASAFQELHEWKKAAKYYSKALTVIDQKTPIKGEHEVELSDSYKLLLAKNSCLFNLGLIHIIWLQKYALAKIFFLESHKPLRVANSLLKEYKDYFSDLIDPQIKDIVGITPLQTELLTFGFRSSVFSFFGALLDMDTDRIEEYFVKLKKLEDLFISTYFKSNDDSFFALLGKLSESISKKNLVKFNEVRTVFDDFYSNSHEDSLEITEKQKPRVALLDGFLNTFKDALLKIFDDLKKTFFNDVDATQ